MFEWEHLETWVRRLGEERGSLVRSTLERVSDAPPDVELVHRLCEETLAAAEIVASCAGAAPDELPPTVRDFVETCGVPDEELVRIAFRAVERVGMQRPEHDDALVDLEERLGAILSA
jgi:Domain of unknown function (DUF4259)